MRCHFIVQSRWQPNFYLNQMFTLFQPSTIIGCALQTTFKTLKAKHSISFIQHGHQKSRCPSILSPLGLHQPFTWLGYFPWFGSSPILPQLLTETLPYALWNSRFINGLHFTRYMPIKMALIRQHSTLNELYQWSILILFQSATEFNRINHSHFLKTCFYYGFSTAPV